MLQDIRDRSTSWISKTIIGLIIVLLSFTGFEAIMSSTSNAENAARVNGQEITRRELDDAKNMQMRRLVQQLGQDFQLDEKMVADMALGSLISRVLLLQDAREAGFVAPQESIDAFLVSAPEFQIDGRFSPERYDQVIGQMGYGRLQFRRMLEEDILLEQLQSGISGSAIVSPQEIMLLLQLERQTRDFSYLEIKPDLNAIEVSAAEIEEFYQANQTSFMTTEQVVAEYVKLSKQSLLEEISISEEELQAAYQDSIANLVEQRRAAHILLEVNGDAQEQQVQQQALELIDRLHGGEKFADLAKQFSVDIGSANNGGDLGFAGLGDFEPEFEQVLYALDKGQVSAPVRTAYGWHIIKLLDVQQAQVLSYADMKQSLQRDLREARAERQFVQLVQDLEGYAYESADLEQPAHELGLQVERSQPFSRAGGEGVFANARVLEAAFSQEVLEDGNNSLPIELDAETVMVVRVAEHILPEQIPLDEVRETIEGILLADKARKLAEEQGSALLAELRAGDVSPDDSWHRLEAVARDQDSLAPELLVQLFKTPRPQAGEQQFSGVVLRDGSYAVLAVSGVNTPEIEVSDAEMAAYIDIMSEESGRQEFASYTSYLEQKAKIERF